MEHTPKAHAELEVTGVSRSGRVCKKSSKLMDFQSPDDITDSKQKKTLKSKIPNTSAGNASALGYLADTIKSEPDYDVPLDDSDVSSDSGDHGNDSSMDSDDDDVLDIEDLEEPHDEDDKSEGELVIELAPKRSLYMTEKSSKYKKMLKDGKRKDKGVRRFTAYMLWAKEARKQMLSNPDLDFGTISKRLGEMWANVPSNQKYNWKRRAKRIANKFKQSNDKALELPFVKRYLHLGQSGSAGAAPSTPVTPTTSSGGSNGTHVRAKKMPQKANLSPTDSKSAIVSAHHHQSPDSPTKTGAHSKAPGFQPTDVAAHLKLLGDSLTIIGERLKEHEGQIAVSGSLSVLLDSLLCSLGPLMCLSIHIPGLQTNTEHLKELFQNTLDNIAYVMPGL
ncbi:HMG box-containing protein 4 isoform X2 [Toxorhynchites rutilus septentrionalis]|uniref:HMG box-containing protein 4 isoform X2 n=1 Tax=Toxorhynchites rutilus septentrionalis TaxID=329112 RepID=UPI002478ADD8|nr:HMG box-containing protein 4 isoform X2 [Toxorhynchites rutilus septentrionalis]